MIQGKYGFRDEKDLKDSNEDDIFVLGDSYSFGYGVEERDWFSNLLESLLIDENPQVYNIGISVSHILNYRKKLEYAKTKGATIKNIILGLCMENNII